MGSLLKRKQWHMWFACLAILLNALSPSLSYAFASLHANANSAAVEICSASGAVYTQADLAQAARSTTDSVLHHIEHCPFCMSHAGSVALPPSSSWATTTIRHCFTRRRSPSLRGWAPARAARLRLPERSSHAFYVLTCLNYAHRAGITMKR